jgi:hypothetical protein
MGATWLHRTVYRVRQFGSALAMRGRPLAEAERTEVRAWLPAAAWPMFDAMPHNDQHHSLNVLHALRPTDYGEPALEITAENAEGAEKTRSSAVSASSAVGFSPAGPQTVRAAWESALMQAALLHDVAKSTGGVTLFHRVAVVLIKIMWPGWLARLAQAPAPARDAPRYPFWAHANHPQLGAEMAAAAGCDPLAVMLIRRHQETDKRAEDPLRGSGGDVDLLLTALRTADDDN